MSRRFRSSSLSAASDATCQKTSNSNIHQQGKLSTSAIYESLHNFVNNNTNGCSLLSVNCDEERLSVKDTQDSHVSSTTSNFPMQELQSLSTTPNIQVQQSNLSIETQKIMIREHPLYPLLAVLFRQCEGGTLKPTSPPSLDLFNDDLNDFIARTEQSQLELDVDTKFSQSPQSVDTKVVKLSSNGRNLKSSPKTEVSDNGKNGERKILNNVLLPVFADDQELNELIVRAIKVLRIHLQELHKVNELSKDFCSRYIHSLKTKFQSELLFQDSEPPSPVGSDGMSPFTPGPYQSYFPAPRYPNPGCNLDGLLSYNSEFPSDQPFSAADMHCASVNGSPEGHLRHSDGNPYPPIREVYHNNYLNELKANGGGGLYANGGGGGGYFQPRAAAVVAALNSLDNMGCEGKTKRNVLPKRATQVMKQWLFQHLVHPYPTEDEKRHIASETKLTLLQVNNWFINARRRILQPMLDSTSSISFGRNSEGGWGGTGGVVGKNGEPTINKKKKAATSRPSNNRFWPASLAAAAKMHPVAAGLVSMASSYPHSDTLTVNSGGKANPDVAASTSLAQSAVSAKISPMDHSSPSVKRARRKDIKFGGGPLYRENENRESEEESDIKYPYDPADPNELFQNHQDVYGSQKFGYSEDELHSRSKNEQFAYDHRGLNGYQSLLQHSTHSEKDHEEVVHGHFSSSRGSIQDTCQAYNNWYHFIDEGVRHSEFRENAQYPNFMHPQRQMFSAPENTYFGQSGGENYDRTTSRAVSWGGHSMAEPTTDSTNNRLRNNLQLANSTSQHLWHSNNATVVGFPAGHKLAEDRSHSLSGYPFHLPDAISPKNLPGDRFAMEVGCLQSSK